MEGDQEGSVQTGTASEEKVEKKYGNYFGGPLNPEKLRREFHLTVSNVKYYHTQELLEFVRSLPGIIKAEYLDTEGYKRSWAKIIAIEFDDADAILKLTPEMVRNDYVRLRFQDVNSNLWHVMERPFWKMGRLLKNRLGFLRFYVKAFQNDPESTIDREAVIFTKFQGREPPPEVNTQSLEICGEILAKWKKALEDWGVKDVENVKVLMSKYHVYYIIVVFKTKEAGQAFVAQSTNLRMDDLKVLTDMVSRIPEILSLTQPNNSLVPNKFLPGIQEENLEADKTLVVCLFDEGLEDFPTIRQFFADQNPETMLDLHLEQSSLLGPHPFHPKLLLTFKTREELEQALLNLDTINNQRTYSEWVYAVPLTTKMLMTPAYMDSSECSQTPEECRAMIEVVGDIMLLNFIKRERVVDRRRGWGRQNYYYNNEEQDQEQTAGDEDDTAYTNTSARMSEPKLIMSLGMFGEKLTNQKLFVKLKEEIGMERSEVKQGDWRRISVDGENKWKAEVVMKCDAEKVSQFVQAWNSKGVNLAGHPIQAELVEIAAKAGKKRKNMEYKSSEELKKIKECISDI